MSLPDVVTLAQRKIAKIAAINAGVENLIPTLAAYARERGGRFILFGSAARGELLDHSDWISWSTFLRRAKRTL